MDFLLDLLLDGVMVTLALRLGGQKARFGRLGLRRWRRRQLGCARAAEGCAPLWLPMRGHDAHCGGRAECRFARRAAAAAAGCSAARFRRFPARRAPDNRALPGAAAL
ncbi:MAG: hypothetical protein ACLS7Z_08420 [Christensenellales bacterium]